MKTTIQNIGILLEIDQITSSYFIGYWMARTTVLEASFVQFSRSFARSTLPSYEIDLDISRCVSAKDSETDRDALPSD